MKHSRLWLASVCALLAAATGKAQPANAPDKRGYRLFNATPATELRELTPDRPDKTESPYTLDAGHFQLEMDFANYTHDDTASTRTRAWNIAPFNLKMGLLDNADLQLVFADYLHVRTKDLNSCITSTQSGIGDLTARLKINLWGNDGGQTAFGLLPFVKFPTSTGGLGNNAVEGGIIFPLAVKLSHGFDLGLQTAFSLLRDESGTDYHGDFIHSITVGHDIAGRLGGYVEFFSDLSTARHAGWIGTVDAGLTFALTKNIQLDCGCNFGVTPAADDFNPFAGITVRF